MSVPVAAESSAHDERLAQLLEELSQQRRNGQRPDMEAVAREHPDLAGELRTLWAQIELLDEVATTQPHPPPVATPESSQILPRRFGDYDLLEELGRGAMGVVYKARQRDLDRIVALKTILRGELATAEELARFQTEARAAAHLDSHPNLVPVYEVGEHDGQAFFSMKYVEGTTLAALLTRGPLSCREAARLLATIARAMEHAHRHGILHRDLKPSNILLSPVNTTEAVPFVTDFGLAKRTLGSSADAGLTQTNAILGTPAYMSPEQAFGSRQPLTPAADVYSLGAILYEMLTGRPPFLSPSPAQTILRVREEEPVPPRVLNPRVDPDLELICLQCLQKAPEARYASAAALAADLEAYLEGEPPSVRSSSLGHFLGRMLRETHHAPVLENWGVLWMWHSLKLFLLCAATNVMLWCQPWVPLFREHWPYLVLWSVGLVLWGAIFWALRRRGGPVLFIERQIAHVWAASVAATIGVFVVEVLLGLPVLTLSPVLALIAAMVFVIKGGMLSGLFYIAAASLFLTAVPMALFPAYGPLLFGAVSAACFFFPGLKYYRQRVRTIGEQGT